MKFMELLSQSLAWKTTIVGIVFAVIIVLERLYPYAQRVMERRGDFKRLGRNFGLFVINSMISPLFVLPVTILAVEHSIGLRSQMWQGGWFIVLDVLLLDFFIYFWHRANHEFSFLWRFHRVHHLDRFMDSSTAIRFHFGEVILSALARGGVVILFDLSLLSVVIYETVLLLCSIFQHSNIRLSTKVERIVNILFVTPHWHWMHHHRLQKDTDSHYGNLLTIWDRMFKSRASNIRTPNIKIGVEGLKERSFLELLIFPFKK